jgi:putative glycosyltransferase (TIGR04348 family)
MQIALATPVRPGVASGNQVTSQRWRRRLNELGHDVRLVDVSSPDADPFATAAGEVAARCDLLVALHARRCAGAIASWKQAAAQRPVVVALAGTDLYVDLPENEAALGSLTLADAIVILQAKALDRLRSIDPALVTKAFVVHQSVELPPLRPEPRGDRFTVAVLAHLRDVKDPLLAARAARRLPTASRVVVVHAGAAHEHRWASAARAEMELNPRYRWRGELTRHAALELLASADVLACTSHAEGGANVVSEAIALGVPVVGTAVDGTTGLLGDDHPGLVPIGDAEALAEVLRTLEGDPAVYAEARGRVEALRHLVDPAHEREGWASVLSALGQR